MEGGEGIGRVLGVRIRCGETLQKSIFLALVLVQLALLGLRPWVLTVHFGPPGGPVGPSLTLR